MTDGNTSPGSVASSNGYYTNNPPGNYGQITSLFLNSSRTIDSVVFYDAPLSYGGWFGTYGAGPDGVDTNSANTLSAAALAAPIFQYTTGNPFDGSSQWITAATTNNYLSQMTGAAVANSNNGNVAPSIASTFTLTTPITGATGVRLVGPAGGDLAMFDNNNTFTYNEGFVSGYEFQVFAAVVPEPSTYAMMFGGVVMLVLVARFRHKLSQ